MKLKIVFASVLFLFVLGCSSEAVKDDPIPIVGYDGTTFTAGQSIATESVLRKIPVQYIDMVRTNLHIAYQHTSHEAHVSRGMFGLQDYKTGDGNPKNKVALITNFCQINNQFCLDYYTLTPTPWQDSMISLGITTKPIIPRGALRFPWYIYSWHNPVLIGFAKGTVVIPRLAEKEKSKLINKPSNKIDTLPILTHK